MSTLSSNTTEKEVTVPDVEQVKAFLLSKGCTLWMNWDLTRPERLQAAAEWFQLEMIRLNSWVSTETVPKESE